MCRKSICLISFVLVLSVISTSLGQPVDPNLIGWWKLDEGAGTIATDSSGRGNNGTINNPNGGLGPGGSVWYNDAERGTVLSFNGDETAGAYVDAGVIVPPMTLTNDFTWAFWAKQLGDGTGVNETMLGNRHGASDDLQFSKFTPTNFEYYNNGNNSGFIPYTIPGDMWIHHAVVKRGANLTRYLNGVVSGSSTINATLVAQPFYMGGDAASERWSGWLSDVRIYNRALSAAEIKALIPPKLKGYKPIPADGAKGVTAPLLQWTAGDTAAFHDVYLGTNPTPGPAEFQTRTPYNMYWHVPGITPGTTYYWRIDEVEADGTTVHTGTVWSFTAQPLTAWNPKPANGATNVFPVAQLSWGAGAGATKHHLYFGDSSTDVDSGRQRSLSRCILRHQSDTKSG